MIQAAGVKSVAAERFGKVYANHKEHFSALLLPPPPELRNSAVTDETLTYYIHTALLRKYGKDSKILKIAEGEYGTLYRLTRTGLLTSIGMDWETALVKVAVFGDHNIEQFNHEVRLHYTFYDAGVAPEIYTATQVIVGDRPVRLGLTVMEDMKLFSELKREPDSALVVGGRLTNKCLNSTETLLIDVNDTMCSNRLVYTNTDYGDIVYKIKNDEIKFRLINYGAMASIVACRGLAHLMDQFITTKVLPLFAVGVNTSTLQKLVDKMDKANAEQDRGDSFDDADDFELEGKLAVTSGALPELDGIYDEVKRENVDGDEIVLLRNERLAQVRIVMQADTSEYLHIDVPDGTVWIYSRLGTLRNTRNELVSARRVPAAQVLRIRPAKTDNGQTLDAINKALEPWRAVEQCKEFIGTRLVVVHAATSPHNIVRFVLGLETKESELLSYLKCTVVPLDNTVRSQLVNPDSATARLTYGCLDSDTVQEQQGKGYNKLLRIIAYSIMANTFKCSLMGSIVIHPASLYTLTNYFGFDWASKKNIAKTYVFQQLKPDKRVEIVSARRNFVKAVTLALSRIPETARMYNVTVGKETFKFDIYEPNLLLDLTNPAKLAHLMSLGAQVRNCLPARRFGEPAVEEEKKMLIKI